MAVNRKTYLIVGLTGHGKSTTGNVIINGNDVLLHPFKTSNGSTSCTKNFQIHSSDCVTVIDTVGFGDPKKVKNNPRKVLDDFKNILRAVDYKINAIIFVHKMGRFNRLSVEFFELFQKLIFKEKCSNNSILLLTNAFTGWTEENLGDIHLKAAYDNCNKKHYEFLLPMENPGDKPKMKELKAQDRVDAIRDFLEYLDNNPFGEIDLRFVEEKEFESYWLTKVIPPLITILNNLANELPEVIEMVGEVASHGAECSIS